MSSVLRLYEFLTNVKEDEYTWNLIDVATESTRHARDLEYLKKIIDKVRIVKLGHTEFPKFWIDDYFSRSILASVLTKLTIEDEYRYLEQAIDVVTARLDSLINYVRCSLTDVESAQRIYLRRYKLRRFVKDIVQHLIDKHVVKLEGSKLYLNTDSITEFIKPVVDYASSKSSYYVAVTRRFLVMGTLVTLGEVTEGRIFELVKDLNKHVNAWRNSEQMSKDVKTILTEYSNYLHVLKIGEWYVWSKFKPLSMLIKEAKELGIEDDVINLLHDMFMNVKAFSTDLIARVIHVVDLDLQKRIQLFDLLIKTLNDVVKSGDYIPFYNIGLIVDAKTYRDIVNIVGDVVSIQRALDVISKIYDKLPIQKENIDIVNLVKKEIGKLSDELSEKILLPYDKFVRDGNKDLKAVLLNALELSGVVRVDIGKNVIEVLDPRAIQIVAVLLGERPLTTLMKKKS